MDLAVFCYDRPDKLKMCLEMVDWSCIDRLWVFCDAAKGGEDAAAVAATRKVAADITFDDKIVIRREKNFGSHNNMLYGIDEVFRTSRACFILEDDCIVRPEAYRYVASALEVFEPEKQIFSINTMAPLGPIFNWLVNLVRSDDLIACKRVYAFWGWATWADRWHRLRERVDPFENPYGSYRNMPRYLGDHVRRTLKRYESGERIGWDAKILTLAYSENMLHIHPRQALVKNVGMDGSGTHFHNRQTAVHDISDLKLQKRCNIHLARFELGRASRVVDILILFEAWTRTIRNRVFSVIPAGWRRSLRGKFVDALSFIKI